MKTFPFLLVFVFCLISASLSAQINVKGKVKNQTTNRAGNKVDKGIDKGLDGVESGVKDLFKKKNKAGDGEQPEEQVVDNASQEKKSEVSDAKEVPGTPSLETYSKFDFIPGEKVVFYEDFSQDAIGDFPALWNTNGSAEVVTTNLFPGKWMKFSGRGAIWTDALLDLPENYTIEFDIIPIKGEDGKNMPGYDFRLLQSINSKAYDHGSVPGKAGFLYSIEYFGRPGYRTYINSSEGNALGHHVSHESENHRVGMQRPDAPERDVRQPVRFEQPEADRLQELAVHLPPRKLGGGEHPD